MNPLEELFAQFIFWAIMIFGPILGIIVFVALCQHGFGGLAMLCLAAFIKGCLDLR